MRLVIDLQGAQSPSSRHRGIGRYTLSLALAMVRNRGQHEVLACLSDLFPESIAPISEALVAAGLPPQAIKVWQAPGPIAGTYCGEDWCRTSAELIREAFLANLDPDMVLVCSLFEGLDAATSIGSLEHHLPTAAILYDLIPLIYRSRYLKAPLAAAWYESKLEHLRQADLVFSISESSRQEGIRLLGLSPEQVVNASTAADQHFRPITVAAERRKELSERYGLGRDFVMYTGGIDSRKNVEGLIRAYALLPDSLRAQHQLAIVCAVEPGARAALQALARRQGLRAEELVLTGYVSEEDLLCLYNLCKVFIFPSLHEGFGLPALEAMSCGCAVIGANSSSVPEVIGREDAMFDPRSDASIAAKLEQVLADEDFRLALSRHGLEQARRFSWDASAQTVIAAMESWLRRQAPPAEAGRPAPRAQEVAMAIAALAGRPSDAEMQRAVEAIALACPGDASPPQALLALLRERPERSRIEAVQLVDADRPKHYPYTCGDAGQARIARDRAENDESDERKQTLVKRILGRLRNIVAPGLSWQRRLRLVPLLGYFLAWCQALLRLPVVRLQIAQEMAALRELQQASGRHLLGIEKALQATTADLAQRLDNIDATNRSTSARVDSAGRRLNSLEALNIAYRLNRLDALDIANRLKVFDSINIANRLNAIDALDIANRLDTFDGIDIANRLNTFDALDIANRLNTFDALDIGNRLKLFDGIDIARRLNDIEALQLVYKLGQIDAQLQEKNGQDRERDNRIAGLAREVRGQVRPAAMAPKLAQAPGPVDAGFDTEDFYLEFESKFRGERKAIKRRMEIYLPHFAAFASDPSARVVDLGCGRGEWLELLVDNGVKASGVDLSSAMVDSCGQLGIEAECADALAWLRRQAPASLAAVTGFHIIEHLPFETLIALFDAALAALRDDGLILFETPNAENLVVGACNFYTDPTHQRPIVPVVAEFIARQRGFAKAEIVRVNAYPDDHLLPERDETARRLNRLLYGPQDYAVLAWKTSAAKSS